MGSILFKPNTLIDLLFHFALDSVRSGKRQRLSVPLKAAQVFCNKLSRSHLSLALPLLSAELRRSPPVRRNSERSNGNRPPSGTQGRSKRSPRKWCLSPRWMQAVSGSLRGRTLAHNPTWCRVREPLRRAAYSFPPMKAGVVRLQPAVLAFSDSAQPFKSSTSCTRPLGTDFPVSCAIPRSGAEVLVDNVIKL